MDLKNINIQMRRYVVVILASLSLLVIYLFFRADYSYELLYSIEKGNIVTRVEYQSVIFGNKTFFVPSEYRKRKKPKVYLNPEYRGFTSGFELIIYWEKNKCYFVSYMDNFDITNPNNDFIFKKIEVDKFMEMKNDTSGYYIYQVEPRIF